MKFNIYKSQKGQSLVELMITIGLAAILMPALVGGFFATRNGRAQENQRVQAANYLKEAQEAVRIVRDKDWANFAANGTYYLQTVGGTWILTATPQTIPGFTRTVAIGDVYRSNNGFGAIVAMGTPGSAIDPSTKKVTTTVAWGSASSSVSGSEYLSRIANASFIDTTQADFQKGTYTSNVAITNTSGGEVKLGPGSGIGDWCSPNLSIDSLVLPKNGVPTAISATLGHAYTTAGGNASGDSLDNVLVTVPSTGSPNASNVGNYDNNNYKTNEIFADGTYEYVTTDQTKSTVVILKENGSSPNFTYSQVGSVNASGKGNSVFVAGNTGYLTAGNKLYTFSVSSIISGSTLPNGTSYNLAGTGNRVIVAGGFAYVATSSNTNQLQKINLSSGQITNLSVNSIAGSTKLNGVDLAIDSAGTTAYLVTNYISGVPDFFVIDLTTMTVKTTGGTQKYNTGGMDPLGVALIPGGRAIIVGNGGEQYQVLKITSTAAPQHCGGLTNPNNATTVNAVSYVSDPVTGRVFSYILSNGNKGAFQIIEGGSGIGGLYASSGTFESQTFDAGHDVAYNYFAASATTPSSTSISYKVSIKHGQSGGSCGAGTVCCKDITFSDADFTPNSFIPPIQLSFTTGTGYTNPGQCLRYRAILSTTDTNTTPVLNDVTFNYSL